MNSGELEVELVPMGTLVERIRAKGAGLGGVLTPTGVGTLVEKNKQTMEIDGKKFIFEKPLGADFALIYGTKVDKFGNVAFFGTTRNFNTTMATAAEIVIVQADEIVECLEPNEIVIPGLFIDYIVEANE
jgi:acetate CoA/acetoacetate CoA-transferase alpha subunit